MDIKELLEHFPYKEPRASQLHALQQIADTWDDTDIYVLELPVAAGKTALAYTVQSYLLSEGSSTGYIVPTNALREQALEEFPDLQTIKRQDEYWIEKYKMTEAEFRSKIYRWGPKDSEYNRDLKAVKRVGTRLVANYFAYMAHKLQRKNVIIDEAHKMLDTLRDLHAQVIWKHQYDYPEYIKSLGQLKEWADEQSDTKAIITLRGTIAAAEQSTIVHQTFAEYRGDMRECIKLLPLSVKDNAPFFWPLGTDKIVLMSATISKTDVEYMGLSDRRVTYIDCPSDIPVENRPFVPLSVANMSYKYQEESIPKIAEKILELADKHEGENGFVHATYGVAKKLKKYLNDDRFLFHHSDNKQNMLDKFKESEGKVMIGSGLYEGLSLSYDMARWQVITKTPFPSLADPAIRYIMRNHSEYYRWLTAKDLLQASGRVCRTPDDKGITYMLDSTFERWYNNTKEDLPLWFKESINGFCK